MHSRGGHDVARSKLKYNRTKTVRESTARVQIQRARAKAVENVPQHVNIQRRPIHGQTGSLRVYTAQDALHARVKKQATRGRLAEDDVLKV